MKTLKALSTISYNTLNFLDNICKLLCEDGTIEEYFYIEHIGEEFDKDHIHLYVLPSKSIDTCKLRERFIEESENPIEPFPLGCMPFVKSDFDNWLLYSLHDSSYLRMKREEKQYSYSIDDVVTNCFKPIRSLYNDAFKRICETDAIFVRNSILNGVPVSRLIEYNINPQLIGQVMHLVQADSLTSNTIDMLEKEVHHLIDTNNCLTLENTHLRENEKFVNNFLTNYQICDNNELSILNTTN